MEAVLTEIIPADGWYAKFVEKTEGHDDSITLYVKLMSFGLFKETKMESPKIFVDGIIATNTSGPVSLMKGFDSLEYEPQPDKPKKTGVR